MNRDDLIKKINAILIDEFELDPKTVTPEARLYEDLEIDSLDGIDLIVAVEKKFGIRVEEKRGLTLRTVSDVYDFIEELSSNRDAKPLIDQK